MLSPAHFPVWLQFVGIVWCPSWYTLVPEGLMGWAHSHVKAVAAALLPDEQSPLVRSNHAWIQLLFQRAIDRGAWLSLHLPWGRCSLCPVSWLWILDLYDGRHTRGSVYLTHFSLCVAVFYQDYLFLSTLLQKGRHITFCIPESDWELFMALFINVNIL